MKKYTRLFCFCLLLGSVLFPFKRSYAQCVTYVVEVCIDGQDKLHIKGNQMWWEHIDFQPPGQHPDCSSYGVGIQVNGNNWGIWDSAYTISDVSCATLKDSTILCYLTCSLLQAPDSANGWETIYDFNDDAAGGPHVYEHAFTFCYADSGLLTGSITMPPVACLGDTSTVSYTGSSGTGTYQWNFGGGTVISGSGQGPYLVNWSNTGVYNVNVGVTGSCAASASFSDTIPVNALPASSFQIPAAVCVGINDTVAYTGNASGAADYTWNFDGGNVVSGTGQGPYLVNWTDAGTFANVGLTVSENGCTSKPTSNQVAIYAVPVVTLAPANAAICAGDSVVLKAHGANNYSWSPSIDLRNTSDSATVASPIITTTYMVSGSNGLCSDTAQAVVNVGTLYNAGNITLSNDTVCDGQRVELAVSGSEGAIQWQASSGGNYVYIDGLTDSVYIDVPSATSSFRVIAGTGVCADTSTAVKLVVNPLPVASVYADNTVFCASDSAKIQCTESFNAYSWNIGDNTPFIYVKEAGGYWVTVTDANGCSAVSDRQSVSVYPVPPVSIIVLGDTLLCLDEVTYQWYLNGTMIPGANQPLCIAQTAGTYMVEVTDTNGCSEGSSEVTMITVGTTVENVSTDAGLNIYPNPASTSTIQLVAGEEWVGSKIEIYDDNGRLVFQSYVRSRQSEIQIDLMKGVYFIQVSSSTSFVTRKMIRL